MNLYLVQHGRSKSKGEDPDRPLTGGGEADVRKVAEYVSAHAGTEVNRIFHSGKTRARQTAEILEEFLQPQGGVEAMENLDPMADPCLWADKFGEQGEDLMLVGHLPHLSRLASLLITGSAEVKVIDFKNGGVVCLNNEDEGAWTVGWILVPEVVE
jgi:phosphohistidine phosphatase